MISRGTVGGRPAGERLFRARLRLSTILQDPPPCRPLARSRPEPTARPYSRRRDTNNEVIPRDATAVSVETPRRRAISHPSAAPRRPIGPRWMLFEGCKRRGREPRGDESSPARGGGRKAVRSHVCPTAEATFVLHDVVGPGTARHGAPLPSRGSAETIAYLITITSDDDFSSLLKTHANPPGISH